MAQNYSGAVVLLAVCVTVGGLVASLALLQSSALPATGTHGCVCSTCTDPRFIDECHRLEPDVDCSAHCAALGCASGVRDALANVPCPVGACCGSNAPGLVTRLECRVDWDGAYAGNGQSDCDSPGACCISFRDANISGFNASVCFNGPVATDCLLGKLGHRSNATYDGTAGCKAGSVPCFEGSAPRLNSNACCQLSEACTSDFPPFLCTALSGSHRDNSVCSASGKCL